MDQSANAEFKKNVFLKHPKLIMIAVIVIGVFLCALYLRISWVEHEKTEFQVAAMLGESLSSQLDIQDITQLSGSQEDLGKTEYQSLKISLSEFVEATSLRFAFLLGEQNGNMIYLVDSQFPGSPDYSAPGQIFSEGTDKVENLFQLGETVMIDSTTDSHISGKIVLVPIKNPENGTVTAVLALDYSASYWNTQLQKEMIPNIFASLLFLIFLISLQRSVYNYSKLKKFIDKKTMDEALYQSVFDQAPVGIAIVNGKKFVSQSEFGNQNTNPMFEKILGRTGKELTDIDWRDITHPDDLDADLEKFEQFQAGKIDGYDISKRFIRPDGSFVWTNMKITHFSGGIRNIPKHLCLLDDISKEKEMAETLIESERSKSVLLSNLPGMAYRCNYDREWTMQFVSAGSIELTGYAPENLVNNKDLSFNDLIVPEYRDLVWNEWVRAVTNKVPFKYEYEITTATGERKWVIEYGQSVSNAHGDVEALEGIVLDISERKKVESTILYNYEHDSDTGLRNVTSLRTQLIIDAAEKTDIKRALILINLSTVQRVNMAYGYNYARDLLKSIATVLNKYSSETRILFKTYETRFLFYMKGYNNKNELWEFSQKVKDALWIVLKAERIGAGIGILQLNNDEEFNWNTITKRALISSYKAISLEENDIGICFFDDVMEAQIQREEDIKKELTNIAENKDNGHLFLQFQPIYDLKTNQICAFEALARLKTDELGNVPPLEFIPIAEGTKLIIPIGWNIFGQALNFQKKLRSQGYDKIGVAINVSAIQLVKEGFTKHLFDMMEEMHVSPSSIEIELTESIFSSNLIQINEILAELREHGVKISIDDFGTGYSSLAKERELKVDSLKIDKYFINRLLDTPSNQTITGDIINMAHKRGNSVVAEGVEYEAQREYLEKNKCDKIQGYLISRPLDEEKAIELLNQMNK